ncbi:MAG: TonB-dependent receptor plug domain-containing protein [Prolixibacteraceae bacterium]|jgi:hypothetical protein|nr:TonB-dependent receptor plug domain-containing protein [Prolixibacteraceae bacterium]MDI9564906.1 TonB-dependent receptor plug domain-containing protein [Bacteroidota bacterium]
MAGLLTRVACRVIPPLQGLQGATNGSLSADTVVKATDVTVLTSFPVGNGHDPVTIKADELQGTNLGNGIQFIRQLNYERGPEAGKVVSDTIRIRFSGGKEDPQPLIILDGKEVPSIDHINQENIESITVLKDKSSLAIYGDKGEKRGYRNLLKKREFRKG